MGKENKFLKFMTNLFTRNVGFKLLSLGTALLIFLVVHIAL